MATKKTPEPVTPDDVPADAVITVRLKPLLQVLDDIGFQGALGYGDNVADLADGLRRALTDNYNEARR